MALAREIKAQIKFWNSEQCMAVMTNSWLTWKRQQEIETHIGIQNSLFKTIEISMDHKYT